jgi:hypothetical protein
MAPIAIHSSPKDSLNAEAQSFKPVGNKQVDPYHSATSATAIATESAYAAHNYHPLPVVFSRAQGVDVWDPEGTSYAGDEFGIFNARIWPGFDRVHKSCLYCGFCGFGPSDQIGVLRDTPSTGRIMHKKIC